MIAFRDALPLIVLRDCTAVAFDRDWLARALSVAAIRAGHPEWPLAPHISASVHEWLGLLHNRPTLSEELLTQAVREALGAVGFPDIGDSFAEVSPFGRISLVELAQQSGNGFELAFFKALDARLRGMLAEGAGYCELHSIEQCVRVLRQCAHWGQGCEALRGEIVGFVRDYTGRACAASGASGGGELFLHVS